MTNNDLKTELENYLQDSQSSYCVVSCSYKEKCREYICKKGVCNNVEAYYLDDIDRVYDFDVITKKFCRKNKVWPIGSCDGIVFLRSEQIILIEFKLGVHYNNKGKMPCGELKEKLLSSLEIIYKLCDIKDRLNFCKNNVLYYVVYNEDIFNAKNYIANTASNVEKTEELIYENVLFAGETSKDSKLLCKFFALDYFKMFLLKDVQVVSKNEFKEIKKKW